MISVRGTTTRSGVVSSLSSVLPTSQVFTSGYVNTETILHFFYKITNERGTKTVFTYPLIKWFYGQSERARGNFKEHERSAEKHEPKASASRTSQVFFEISSAYITQQCSRNKFFYFFYKMYRELHALVPMT